MAEDQTPTPSATPSPAATPAPATPAATPAAPAAAATPAATTAAVATPLATPAATPEVPASPAKGYWPDDWAQRISKGDDKRLQRISRYASPEALGDALIAAQNRISAGELKPALPANAKPEELAVWRKDNGIPEKPEGYDLNLGDGLVIGEKDKPIIDGFLKTAHDSNMRPDEVKATLRWYYTEVERQAQARELQDNTDRQHALDALNSEWGATFRRNVNMVQGLLDRFPEAVRDAIKSARLGDGRGLFNDPDVMRGFAALALELNPAGTVVPSGMADPAKSVDEKIAAIEKTMRENRGAYNKDEKMQADYRLLLDTREKLKERKAA